MVEGDFGFCLHCGASIRPGTAICPHCGQPTGQVSVQTAQVQNNGYAISDVQREFNNRMIIFMLAIYAAFTILTNVWVLIDPNSSVTMLKSFYGDDSWAKLLSNSGMSTDAEYIKYLVISSEVAFLSGIFTLIALILVITRKHCMFAVIACSIASFELFAVLPFCNSTTMSENLIYCILECMIGLMVARMIFRQKSMFES